MEQQFILKLPDSLQSIDLSTARIVKVSATEVALSTGDAVYTGAVCRLPTIVESHKDVDGKLYKIADISTVISVLPQKTDGKRDPREKDAMLRAEIQRVETSGLTPPMTHVREWRRRVQSSGDGIDKRLAELLREDAKAIKVEIVERKRMESSDDLDMIAAEIEDNIEAVLAPQPRASVPTTSETAKAARPPTAPVVSQSGQGAAPAEERSIPTGERPVSIVKTEEMSATAADPGNDAVAVSEQPAIQPPTPRLHPELIEIENKLKEKQRLRDNTLNPILKKRFSDTIEALTAEYEAKKKKLDSE